MTVRKAAIHPAVKIRGWTAGAQASEPSVTGNAGNGKVTYTYAKKGTAKFSKTVPGDAGAYTVKATVEETGNYLGGEATADFTVAEPEPETVVWDMDILAKLGLKTGERFSKGGVTLICLKGVVNGDEKGASFNGYNFKDDSFRFESERAIVRIEITGRVHTLKWSGAEHTAKSVVWTGDSFRIDFGKHMDRVTKIVFTLGEGERQPIPEADFATPAALKRVGEEAFMGIGATSVRVSDKVKTLGSRAFAKCPNLRRIYIPETVKEIPDDLLKGCKNVTVYGRSDAVRRFAEKNGYKYVEVK